MVRTRSAKIISNNDSKCESTQKTPNDIPTKQNATKSTPQAQPIRRSSRIHNTPKLPNTSNSEIQITEILYLGTTRSRKRALPKNETKAKRPKLPVQIKVEPGSEIPDEYKNFNFDFFIEILPLNTPNFGVIFEIFKFLTRTDLDKCQFVCKTWKNEIEKDVENLALRPIEIAIKPGLETCNFVAKERPGLWLAMYGFLNHESKQVVELNKENMPKVMKMGCLVSLKMRLTPSYWETLRGILPKQNGQIAIERVQNVSFTCSNIQNLRSIPTWFKKQAKIDELSITIAFNFYQDSITDLNFLQKLDYTKIKLVINTYVAAREEIITRSIHDALDDLGCEEKCRDIEVNQFNWKVSGEDGFL